MEILWIFVFLILFLISFLLYSSRRDQQYFRSRNVYPIPNSGMIGLFYLFYNMIWRRMGIIEIVQEQYDNVRKANVKIAGNMEFGKENYFVMDLEYIKHMLVKDFDHFVNRRALTVPTSDRLVKKMVSSKLYFSLKTIFFINASLTFPANLQERRPMERTPLQAFTHFHHRKDQENVCPLLRQ